MIGYSPKLTSRNRQGPEAVKSVEVPCVLPIDAHCGTMALRCIAFFKNFGYRLFNLPILLFVAFHFISLNTLNAEGTKELAPNSTDVTMLYTNDSGFGSFAAYNGPSDSRLNFYVADPDNEQVFLGFSRRSQTNNGVDGVLANTNYYFRIKDPNGNVVYGPQLINGTTANADTWALATAGPAPVVGGSGYTPFTFDPSGLSAGDYYVEFSYNANSATSSTLAIKYWDITVATDNGGTPSAIDGRVWSSRWSFRTPSISQGSDPTYTYFDRPFNGQVYLYTFDGFVSKIDFENSGFRGLSFNLAYNEYGVVNTGDLESDRRSIQNSNNTLPEYRIFLNDPDLSVYPSGSIGSVTTNPIVVDCDPGDLCVSYEVSEIGYVFILLDFDSTSGNGLYDQNTADVLLYEKVNSSGALAPYEGCIPWDGLDGNGVAVPSNAQIPVYMNYAQGMVHFPVYDVEYITTGFIVEPIRPLISGFTQRIYYDDTNIPDAPGNGNDKDMVNGCLPPCHDYTNSSYGDLNTINTWWFTNQEFVVTVQESDCTLNAYDDNASTTQSTPVLIDVSDNDTGDNLDVTTVSTTGVLQPSNGGTSINSTTGDITYTPASGFIGLDTFEYVVCDIGGSPCDTATVFVSVTCGTSVGNVISGAVFQDLNSDGNPGSGEPGEQGVTVILYEDNNGDGQVDGGDTQISTTDTDIDGNYSFTVSNPVGTTYNYDDIPSSPITLDENAAPCVNGSEITRNITISDSYTVSDMNFGFNAIHTWRSDIEVSIESPSGTVVNVINYGGDSNNNLDVMLDSDSGNPINDGGVDNTAAPYYDRTASPSNSLDAFNGEQVNGTWIIKICDNAGGDVGTYERSRLQITSAPKSYVLEIDLNDLPCGASMVSDNVEVATFLQTNTEDCANNFGFLPSQSVATASSNSPVCEGGNVNLQETGGDAVSWSWSGPNSFNSTVQNPSISSVTSSNAGSYTVTITDGDGCTHVSNSVDVVVNSPVNAGTAVSNETICLEGSGLATIDLFSKLTGEQGGGTWSSTGTSAGSNFNAGAGTLNPNGLQEATYTFRYTLTGNAPCPNDFEEWSITVERCCPPNICLPLSSSRN